jgi:hypothetical protein
MQKAIIYTYATLDSRNSGWYKVGLTTTDADKRIAQQDTTSNYQKPEKLLEFDFTDLVNKRGISVETIEKEFHNYLQYKLRCMTRQDKQREWFITDGLGPIYQAKDYVMNKYDVEPKPIIRKSPSGKYLWQWLLVLKPLLLHFTKGFNKAHSVIFCGGGKTILSYWMTRLIRPVLRSKINLTVVCVPSIYLIKQTLEEYQQQQQARSEEFDFMCVCSDKQVANTTESDISASEVPFSTTNEKLIRQFATKEFNKKGLRVIFTTYQSGKVLAKALKGIKVDFVIYDEAHKATGDTRKAFAHLVLDRNFKAQYKWFITATPKNWDGHLAS